MPTLYLCATLRVPCGFPHIKFHYFHYMNDVNILLDILKQLKEAHPASAFVSSLYQQFCVRGGLSKKQLEGLYNKAEKSGSLPQHKLATLEAIIKKKPTRERAAATRSIAAPVKDEATGATLEAILSKYPQHKRLLFLRSKHANNEHLSAAENEEIQKFKKLLLK